MSVSDLLQGMLSLRASDLFFKTGAPVRFKIAGRVTTFEGDSVDREKMDHVLRCFLGTDELARFHERMVADVVFEAPRARYRIHFAYGQSGPYGTVRVISREILALEKLNHPQSLVERLLEVRSGLLIVCGTTDAGKTVTCTSLLDYMNHQREVAILTLEDPVEYILADDRSVVIQREVGLHVASFREGIRSGLRENLDVIFVGEMRDLETIELVLRAAEMGHLVISTLHADDVLAAILRIVGSFPPSEQPRIRQSLANVLQGVIYQRLLPMSGGGRVPCTEAMWPNTAVRTIVRAGDLTKLGTYVGKASGGSDYRESLHTLLRDGRIAKETFDEEQARLRAGA
jgi:twitching motility protein PilT